jgi:Family of unknown function (DUF5681)
MMSGSSLRAGSKQGRREPTQRQLEALKPTQFQPGQSGNAGGRPKKTPITDALRQLIEEEYSGKQKRFKGLSNVRVIALRMFELAIAGDLRAMQEIADRVEGKVAQRQELAGPDGGAIPWMNLSREENERRLAVLLARAGHEN